MGVMTSETLARAGALGGLMVREARSKGRDLAGPGRSLVSMVLTLKAYRRRTPKKNRRISTIPAGCFDGRLVNVSAVDTGPRRSESGVLAAEPGAYVSGPPPPSPARRLRWGTEAMTRLWPRPELARVGLLHEGRDLLAKGCAYCTKVPPTPSAPNPRPVAPHLRAVHPDDAVRRHSDRVSPLRQAEAAALTSLSRLADAPNRCLDMS